MKKAKLVAPLVSVLLLTGCVHYGPSTVNGKMFEFDSVTVEGASQEEITALNTALDQSYYVFSHDNASNIDVTAFGYIGTKYTYKETRSGYYVVIDGENEPIDEYDIEYDENGNPIYREGRNTYEVFKGVYQEREYKDRDYMPEDDPSKGRTYTLISETRKKDFIASKYTQTGKDITFQTKGYASKYVLAYQSFKCGFKAYEDNTVKKNGNKINVTMDNYVGLDGKTYTMVASFKVTYSKL